MQTVARQSSRVVARSTRSVRVAKLNVVCKATVTPAEAVKKVAAAAAGLPVMLAASPAFALVDERLNGDGTGLPLGISDGSIGWPMLGVFAVIWTVWYLSQKDLGDFEDQDSGLKID